MTKKINLNKTALKNFKNFLFDCDGVIWRHLNLLPGAKELLDKLKSLNKLVLLVSNNSTISSEQYTEKCKMLNLNVETDQIVSASNVLANYLKKRNVKGKVYVVGEEGISIELNKVNIPNFGVGEENRYFRDLVSSHDAFDNEVTAVVVGFDNKFNLSKMTLAASYIACKNCTYYATNADAVFPTQHYLIPGTGSMVKAIETASNTEPIITGKPHSPMMEVIIDKYKINPSETLMIGDNLYTDITFGNRHNLSTLLVFTGVTTPTYMEKVISTDQELKPTYYCDSLQDLLDVFNDK